jgi:hypothetical protein
MAASPDPAADVYPSHMGFRESELQLFLQDRVDLLRVGLALALLHDLADEEAEQLVFAGAVLLHLARVGGDDGVDHLLDGAGVGDLLQALGLDHRVGVAFAGPHGLEHLLGDLAGEGVVLDAGDQAGELLGARPGCRRCRRSSLFSAAASAPLTQLAASLASPQPPATASK